MVGVARVGVRDRVTLTLTLTLPRTLSLSLSLSLTLALALTLSLSLTRALTLTQVGLEIRRKGAAADAKETLVITRDKVRYSGDTGEIQGGYRGDIREI